MFNKLSLDEWYKSTGDIVHHDYIKANYIGDYIKFVSPFLVQIKPNQSVKIQTGLRVDPSDELLLHIDNDIHKDYVVTNYSNIYNNIVLEVYNFTKEIVTINTGDILCYAKTFDYST
jgi:hypothetical protein